MNHKTFLPAWLLIVWISFAPPPVWAQATAPTDPVEDSQMGAWASVGCGIMVKATIFTGGTQVGTIAGAVACCGYMLFDAYCEGVAARAK